MGQIFGNGHIRHSNAPFSMGTEYGLADAAGLEQTKAEQHGIAHAAQMAPAMSAAPEMLRIEHRIDANDNHNQERLEA